MKYSALALLLVARAFGAENGLPEFLPPGTKVMLGLQVRRMLNSSLIQAVRPALDAGALPGAAQSGMDWQKIVALAGFDPFKDIEEVLIASAGEGKNPTALVVARGNFNVERFSANATRYHSVPVLATGKSSTGAVALLDANTAILGEITEVYAAIDRRGSHLRMDPALAARANDLRASYELWGLGKDIANLVQQSGQADGMDSFDRFQFGVSVGHGLEVVAEAHARSAKDAEKLRQSAALLEFLMRSQTGSATPRIDIQEDHGTLKLALSISEEELKKIVEARRAEVAQQPVDTSVKIVAPADTPSPKPGAPGSSVVTLPGAARH